jgi:hypothetical protein
MDKVSLEDILNDDPFNLLGEIKAKNPVITQDDRLIASFEEINDFYEKNGTKPQKSTDMNERRLCSRLEGIINDPSKVVVLRKYDRFNLLEKDTRVESIEDIFLNDPLNLLNSDEDDIFTLKNIPKTTTMPDYVASRKPCKEFDDYEELFLRCQDDLKTGKRKLIKFQNEQQIKKGYYFVLKGVLLYVAKVGKSFKKDNKTNARLRLIFENGTESDMLLRSLSAELYKHGKRVSEYDESKIDGLYKVNEDDKKNGYIYILKSLSQDDRILTKRNLYKIGFSTTTVEKRIKNASQDPTYLMADVQIVSVYEVYNINPHKLEQLIHKFFSDSCLDIDIIDSNGKLHRPKEWFVAPLDVIQKAVELIINGEIVNYRYDVKKERINKK